MSLPLGISPVYLGGIVLLFIALIFHIVGLSTPCWSVYEKDDDYSAGLWQFCDPGCDEYDSDHKSSKLEAAEALSILGMVFGVFALVMAILQVILSDRGLLMAHISTALALFAFIWVFITVVIWGAKLHDDWDDRFKMISPYGADLGYSWALCLVAFLMFLIGGAMVAVGARLNESVST